MKYIQPPYDIFSSTAKLFLKMVEQSMLGKVADNVWDTINIYFFHQRLDLIKNNV